MSRHPANPRCTTCQGGGEYLEYDPMQGNQLYTCPCTKAAQPVPPQSAAPRRDNVVRVDFTRRRGD